jgi:hypothetical protein
MINRASVQMWGIVGQSAGPPKWAGKKNDRLGDAEKIGQDHLVDFVCQPLRPLEMATICWRCAEGQSRLDAKKIQTSSAQ